MNKCKLKRKSTLKPLASFDAEGFSVSEIKRFKKLLFISLLLSSFFLYGAAFAANSTPLAGAVTPASGTSNPNVAVHFTTTFSDRDGWQNIQYTCLLVNKDTSGANCCYVYYNQNTNKLYLRNDSDTRWLGGYTPGSSYVIENSYANLDCSRTTVTGSTITKKVFRFFKVKIPGPTMTINWNIIFKPAFAGLTFKKTYLCVRDDSGAYSGWLQKGIWTIQVIQVPEEPAVLPEITITDPINGQVINAEP